MGPETKIYCSDKGKEHFSWPTGQVYVRVMVLSELWDSKIWLSPMKLENKTDCDGEDQQQFT